MAGKTNQVSSTIEKENDSLALDPVIAIGRIFSPHQILPSAGTEYYDLWYKNRNLCWSVYSLGLCVQVSETEGDFWMNCMGQKLFKNLKLGFLYICKMWPVHDVYEFTKHVAVH